MSFAEDIEHLRSAFLLRSSLFGAVDVARPIPLIARRQFRIQLRGITMPCLQISLQIRDELLIVGHIAAACFGWLAFSFDIILHPHERERIIQLDHPRKFQGAFADIAAAVVHSQTREDGISMHGCVIGLVPDFRISDVKIAFRIQPLRLDRIPDAFVQFLQRQDVGKNQIVFPGIQIRIVGVQIRKVVRHGALFPQNGALLEFIQPQPLREGSRRRERFVRGLFPVKFVRMSDVLPDHLLQHSRIDIGKFIDVHAPLSDFVFSELRKQLFPFSIRQHKIERQRRLSRRKGSQRGIAFMAASVPIMIFPESDDARPPHFGFLSGHFRKQLQQRICILFLLRLLDFLDELLYGYFRGFGLRFVCHLSASPLVPC